MLLPSVSISCPQPAGQLFEEHFPKRMIQHSKRPKGLLCSNLTQKSLSDGYLAIFGKGVHSSRYLPPWLLVVPGH